MDIGGALFGGVGIAMAIGFVVFGLLFVAVVVFIIVAVTRNARKARELGHDPLTMETELTARAIDSRLLAGPRPVEARLAELDDLRARGVITEDEYRVARQKAIGGL